MQGYYLEEGDESPFTQEATVNYPVAHRILWPPFLPHSSTSALTNLGLGCNLILVNESIIGYWEEIINSKSSLIMDLIAKGSGRFLLTGGVREQV